MNEGFLHTAGQIKSADFGSLLSKVHFVCGVAPVYYHTPDMSLPLLPLCLCALNWHHAKLGTHDRLVRLVANSLIDGPRALPPAEVHSDVPISELPASYGLSSHRNGQRRPDLVAADWAAGELLLIEVTIVPDAAVGRYVHRKLSKYADLCRGDAPSGVVLRSCAPYSTARRSAVCDGSVNASRLARIRANDASISSASMRHSRCPCVLLDMGARRR